MYLPIIHLPSLFLHHDPPIAPPLPHPHSIEPNQFLNTNLARSNHGLARQRPQIRLPGRRQLQLGRSRHIRPPRKLPRPQPQGACRPLASRPRPPLVCQGRRRRFGRRDRRNGPGTPRTRAQGGTAKNQRSRGGCARARPGTARGAARHDWRECRGCGSFEDDWAVLWTAA